MDALKVLDKDDRHATASPQKTSQSVNTKKKKKKKSVASDIYHLGRKPGPTYA